MNSFLDVKGVSKTFPGVKALDNVNLHINKREIHGLIGENGAGKSTIIKILAGVYKPDSGSISFLGNEIHNDTISHSLSRGISVIYQELCLVPYMKVYENIMLGFEPSKGLYSGAESRKRAAQVIEKLGLELPLDAEVRKLDIAVQQMVEIAKAFSRDSKLIIMDEPTSSLSLNEIEKLYKIIRNLKNEGVSILFVSHKLEEISEICDRCTIFRDGKTIISKEVGDLTRDQMVFAMVGRTINNYYTSTHTPKDKTLLEVKNLSKAGVINDVSFKLNEGEVLGMTGLIGAGRSETARMLFGLDTFDSGEILLEGKTVSFRNPHEAMQAGVVMVPENRKEQGLIPQMGVGYNMTIAVLKKFIKFIRVKSKIENDIIDKYMKSLGIKAYSPLQLVSNLSGGNQQKAIFGRWLATSPKVLILDEPTRGVDVGAKTEIYGIIDELAKSGVAILLISSELPEVINTSDRIVVMSKGAVVATLNDKDKFSQETIIKYCIEGAVVHE
ncbi:MAG: sugar ABC transporter ATP-binding protein [Eubacteriales bacterium]|nr:sugar ABC transporter ATP-binding protein [Eubacteriales bacterium]